MSKKKTRRLVGWRVQVPTAFGPFWYVHFLKCGRSWAVCRGAAGTTLRTIAEALELKRIMAADHPRFTVPCYWHPDDIRIVRVYRTRKAVGK